jgi:hypothetical protein
MNVVEVASQFIAAIEACNRVLTQSRAALKVLRPFLKRAFPDIVYENVFLEASLDIEDTRGKRAVLHRRQRVRFLINDTSVIRDLVWGEGNPIARYAVDGGRRLSIVPEGSKRAILLGVAPQPVAGTYVQVASRRVIKDGLTERSEYFEAMVERPTGHLALKVLFPPGSIPRDACVVTSPKAAVAKRVPIRWAANGRPYVRWRHTKPEPFQTYGIRWSW